MINSNNLQKLYNDVDFDFKKNEITDDVKTRLGINSISQSIKNIILTSRREKPFNNSPWYGAYDNLFENYDPFFVVTAKSKIASSINVLEPRVTVSPNDIEITQKSDFNIEINIKYTVKNPVANSMSYTQTLTLEIGGQ